jgi:predicted amidohydrolase YtcJ
MFEPYANRAGERGLPRMSQERLNEYVLRANRAGFPVALHAIGDRAVHMALDSFENSRAVLGTSLRNRVEHASVIAADDVPRFGKLGVVASVQPAFMFYATRKNLAVVDGAIGPERMKGLFLWKSLTNTGATLIGSSDFPSSGKIGPDPIAGLHCLIHRTLGDGTPFIPEETLDPDSAIAVYTSTAAEVIGMGKTLGRIAVGYEADLVLLDQDPRLGVAVNALQNPPRKIWIGGNMLK